MAKLTFLGSGGDIFSVGKGVLSSGGVLLEIDNNLFLIDPGVGTIRAAKNAGVNLRRVVGVLVTSSGLHHCHDLPAVLAVMSHEGFDPHGVVLAPSSVVSGYDGSPPLLHPSYARFAEKVVAVGRSTQRVGINSVEIKILPAVSVDESAVGFQIVGSSERISFTGDTGLSEEVMQAHMGASTLVCNLALPAGESDKYHLSEVDVARLAEVVNPRILVITHFSVKILRKDPRSVGRDLSTATSARVVVAEDGLELNTLLG